MLSFLNETLEAQSLWHCLNVFGVWLMTAHHMALYCHAVPKPDYLWSGSSRFLKRPKYCSIRIKGV